MSTEPRGPAAAFSVTSSVPPSVTSFVSPDPDFDTKVRGSFARQAAMGLIGARMSVLEPGYCELRLPFREDLTQQHGFVHGGIVGMIADSACGYAGYSMMPPGGSVLTVEYKINMLAPAQGEEIVARGRVIKPGRTLVVTQCEVFAVQGGAEKLAAVMQQTLMVMQGRSDYATEQANERATKHANERAAPQ